MVVSFALQEPASPSRSTYDELTSPEIAAEIPRVAFAMESAEKQGIDCCQSSALSVAKLRELMKTLP